MTCSVVNLFQQRVGSYYSKTKDEFEAGWVKGIFDLIINLQSTQGSIGIITCYTTSTTHFTDPNFQPTFDCIDVGMTDYNIVNNDYYSL